MKLSIPLSLTLTGSLATISSGISISPPTHNKIMTIESEHKKASPGPLKFAEPHEVSVNLCNDGEWVENTWNLYIESPGAKNLNFGFKNLDLPAGAEMRINSAEKASNMAEMKVDKSQVHASGQFWTPVLDTDRVNISIEFPTNISAHLPCKNVDLGFINVGFRSFSGEKSGGCNVDVVCPERVGWEKEIKSVAGVSWGGSLFCTGTMINNMNQDQTPYFLTANHCGIRDNNAASLVTYWNFETNVCGGNPDGVLNQATTGGATVIAGNSQSDITLLKLNNSPDPSYGVTFAGWDNTPEEYTLPGVCIHHPSGDEKRISFENDPMKSTNYLQSNVSPSGTHVKVADWDLGTTEPGSSGSPLFNGNHRIIGQLHGGYAACGNDSADWYGRFSVSWENNPNLSQALDPNDILGGGFGGINTHDPFSSPTISPAPTETPTEPVPTASPTECNGNSFSLRLLTDSFGSEVNWSLTNEETNNEVLSGGPYENNALIEVDECINAGCYEFEILDSFGDGICCSHDEGYYTITVDGVVVEDSDGTYGSSEYVNFCITASTNPPNPPTATPPPNPPTNDVCIPAGSNCFTTHPDTGCSNESCEQKVCDEREKCCNKKWNDKCANKALQLCTPCACDENPEGLFLLKMKQDQPVTKSCEWLEGKSAERRESICEKTHSFGGLQAARVVCSITCELETCL